jgi:hypothetical protein
MNRLGKSGVALAAMGILVAINAGSLPGTALEYGGLIVGLGAADVGILLILLSEYDQ